MCLMHKWEKWQSYARALPERRISKNWTLSAAVELRQRRECSRCGKTQDEFIKLED